MKLKFYSYCTFIGFNKYLHATSIVILLDKSALFDSLVRMRDISGDTDADVRSFVGVDAFLLLTNSLNGKIF